MTLQESFEKIYKDSKDYADKKIQDAIISAGSVTMDDVINAIIADNLSEQKWKPSVTTFANLPTIGTSEQGVNWLCIVTGEAKIYQRVAGSGNNWQFYSDVIGDFINTTELNSTISTHNTSTTSHSDIRNLISTLDSSVVKKTGDQTINGIKTFSNPVNVGIPTDNTHAATKLYTDASISGLEVAINATIDTISEDFRETNNLD